VLKQRRGGDDVASDVRLLVIALFLALGWVLVIWMLRPI